VAKPAKKAAPALAFYNTNVAPAEGQRVAFRPVWCREHHISGPWPCECPPGPQILALNSLADETNYGGARGGGKSEVALGFLIKGNPPEWCSELPVDVSYVNSPKYRALILRESLVELEAFFDRACTMYEPMGATSSKGSPYMIEWPSGAKFIFGYLADEKDVRKYLGPEYHRVVIEQAEQLASEEAYRALFGSMRSTVPGIHCQVFLTTNPGSGPRQAWIKRRFIDLYAKEGKKVPPKTMVRIKYMVDGQPVYKTRIFIPAGVRDNPYIKPEYLANLMDQPEHIRKAWLDGDWDATVGQFFPEFRDRRFEGEPPEALHVVPRAEMNLKAWWPRWMAMDWGYTHPTVVGFFCENPQSQQVSIYKELCFAKQSPQQAGVLIAESAIEDLRGLEEKVMVLAMSPDAFDEEEHSTAAQIQSGINSVLGPNSCFIMKYDEHEKGLSPDQAWQSMLRRKQAQRSEYKIILIRANNKRIHGWNRLRDMFRWKPLHDTKNNAPDAAKANEILQTQGIVAYHKYLTEFDSKVEVLPKMKLARECKATTESIKLMIFARSGTKLNTGDAEKIDGDDGADMARYGVMAYEPSNRKQPEREFVEQNIQLHPGMSVTTLIHASDELRHQYKTQNPGSRSFTLRRAGRGVYSGEQAYTGVR